MVFEISSQAYYKTVLHCLKYPQYAVNGVLVGKYGKGDFKALDAIPLFHLSLGTSPMFEVALTQIDCYCQKNDMKIVAYYQANESVDCSEPNVIAKTVVDLVKTNYPSAQLVMVDNEILARRTEKVPLTVYSTSKWEPVDSVELIGGQESLERVITLLQNNNQQSLIDFDSHLDDVMLDWLNPAINQTVANSVGSTDHQ